MNRKHKAILYIVLSSFCFALMSVFVRLAGDIPSVQKSFFRNLIAFFFAVILLMKNKIWLTDAKKNRRYLILPTTIGTLGIFCNFYAVDHLVLADASMLNKMSPFFAIVFSFLILGEKVKPTQAFCVVGAFIGSLFILKPTFANMALVPSLIGLCGGLFAGVAYTFVRLLGERGEKGPFIVFFFSGFSCLVSLPYLLLHYHPMSASQLGFLLLAGLAASGGQFSITAAYCNAPAREISVYDYSQIIFSALLGFLLFSQMPDFLSVIGYLTICVMAVVMFLYNNRKTC